MPASLPPVRGRATYVATLDLGRGGRHNPQMARLASARPASSLRLGERVVLACTSVLGLGYAPLAPGTVGTLAALPLWYALAPLTLPAFVAVTAAFTLLACWLSGLAEDIYGTHDVQRIVLDEVVGLLWAVVGVPCGWPTAVAAFVGFRVLDATKPGPIGWVDARVPGGTGVVLDDVAAGLVTCAGLHAAHAAGLLAW